MWHCTIAPQPFLHANLRGKGAGVDWKTFFECVRTRNPVHRGCRLRCREGRDLPQCLSGWHENGKEKKKSGEPVRMCCVCVRVCLKGGGERERLLVEFITGGFVVGLHRRKDRVPSVKVKRKRGRSPKKCRRSPGNSCSEWGRIRVQYLYTPWFGIQFSKSLQGFNHVHTTFCFVAGRGSLIPF